MGDDKDLQAADWLSRLRTRSVGNADLAEFARWRRLPGNAEAYRRAETLWEDADHLREDPEVMQALGSAMRSGPRRTTRLVVLGAVIASVVLALVGVPSLQPETREQHYRTAVGERSSAELADGSRMTVDADSDLRVRLGADDRRIEIVRGQALFTVRSDPSRPFVVTTPADVSIEALGTRFDVEAFTNGDVSVALLEGSVAVSRSGSPLLTLAPGETLLVRANGRNERRRDLTREATDWTRGRLVFREASLSDAVAQINRYATPPVEISTSSATGERVSGEFSVDDPEGFVRGVNALLGPGTVGRPRD